MKPRRSWPFNCAFVLFVHRCAYHHVMCTTRLTLIFAVLCCICMRSKCGGNARRGSIDDLVRRALALLNSTWNAHRDHEKKRGSCAAIYIHIAERRPAAGNPGAIRRSPYSPPNRRRRWRHTAAIRRRHRWFDLNRYIILFMYIYIYMARSLCGCCSDRSLWKLDVILGVHIVIERSNTTHIKNL